MGNYRGTLRTDEPDDMETLYMYPSWWGDDVISQSVSIAPIRVDNCVSVIFSKIQKTNGNTEYNYIHFTFLPEETDMLIEALIKAKLSERRIE